MSTFLQLDATPPPPQPVDARWLWALRIATVVVAALPLGLLVALIFEEQLQAALIILLTVPCAAYARILWLLRRNPPDKRGLALAVSLGGTVSALFLSVVFQSLSEVTLRARFFEGFDTRWLLFVAAYAALLVSAAVAQSKLKKQADATRWLWAVRAMALATLLLAGRHLSEVWLLPLDRVPPTLLQLVVLAGIVVVAAVILWSLRAMPRELRGDARSGLLLAILAGALFIPYCLWAATESLRAYNDYYLGRGGREFWTGLVISTFSLCHLAYTGAAVRTYYLLKREPRDVWQLVRTAAVTLAACFFLLVLVANIVTTHHWPRNEPSAVNSLRSINTAQVTYAQTYGGFSHTLVALGPPPAGTGASAFYADLIDSVLASGMKSGYRFVYTPGPPDSKGRITSYTVAAQPTIYGKTGNRSFFTDESGAIRQTIEDRPATRSDPPI